MRKTLSKALNTNQPPRTSSSSYHTSSPDTDSVIPRIDSVSTIGSTKWVKLQTLSYIDEKGSSRKWDMATRTTKKKNAIHGEESMSEQIIKDKALGVDAVVIVPILRSRKHHSAKKGDKSTMETLLVEQYRPPVRTKTLEFPAGLIDDGESAEEAAIRELEEETGYVGTVSTLSKMFDEQISTHDSEKKTRLKTSSGQLCMSPGLCDEIVKVVLLDVNLDDPRNINPKQKLDQGEFCAVRRVSLVDNLRKIVMDDNRDASQSSGNNRLKLMPLAGLYMFALGLEFGRKI
eukprot:CAMPEP_0184867804 /NCGR_PEP_ID=MMETSP0580-20130426/27775_1 /TAXON_ID=1118495 /ORGANISM="Dactyliosolen fragilissimus" /LENGTH=288 /DNA_ID=CAMNT_0027368261 /DNA_START=54 /DNA_END=920 /DNA_ORIENTATION=-